MSELASSPSRIVQELLIQAGVCSDPTSDPVQAWPVYYDGEPSTPDNVVTVYDTDGEVDGRTGVDNTQVGRYGLKIRFRSVDSLTGWLQAGAVKDKLLNALWQELTVDEHTYLVECFSGIGRILRLGKESPTSKRNLFTVNAFVAVTQTG